MFQALPLRAADVRPPALVVTGLVATVLIGERALSSALDGIHSGDGTGFPFWFPAVGTVGETAVFYMTLFDAITFVAIPAALVWLGYALGRRHSPD